MTTPTKRAPRRKPENAEYLKKAPSDVQIGLSEYIGKTTGHVVSEGDVALVLRLYPLYLKSPAIAEAKEAEKAAREAEKAAKEQAKRDRLQARLDKIEAERAKVLADLGIEGDLVDASDRFTDDKGIEFAQSDPGPTDGEAYVDADGDPIVEDDLGEEWGDEPEDGPINVEPGPGADLSDEDDWADEPDDGDEEDF